MEELTQAQQIFSIFYAIFLGTMLQTIGARRSLFENNPYFKIKKIKFEDIKVKNASLNLFDTPNAWAIGMQKDNKPFWRTIISIIFLNILPGIIFAIVFSGLGYLSDKELQEGWQLVVKLTTIVWISLIPQQIYRVFYALLARYYDSLYLKDVGKEYKKYFKFIDYDIAARALLWEDRLQFDVHGKYINHLAFPIFLYLPSTILFYNWLLVPDQINCIFIGAAWTLLIIGIIGSVLNRFSERDSTVSS